MKIFHFAHRYQGPVPDSGFSRIANMWLAIFADVGVMVLAVLNAVRALFVKTVTWYGIVKK